MIKSRQILLSILFLFVFSSIGSAITQVGSLDLKQGPNTVTAKTGKNSHSTAKQDETIVDDLIHYGDLIDIDILGSIEYDWRGTVTPEGFLTGANFSGDEIYVACQKNQKVEEQIAKSYGKFLKNPRVVVSILDRSKRALSMIFGAIKQPLRFSLRRKVYLNELIILSGGFTENAKGNIQILRQPNASCAAKIEAEKIKRQNEEEDPEGFVKIKQTGGARFFDISISDLLKGKKSANPEIYYGDIITVQKAEPIYVIGGVENPSRISLRSDLTVSRAISSAGGLIKGANAKDITIFRRMGASTIIIKVNLEEIIAKKVSDPKLEAFDVVEVSGRGAGKRKYAPVFRSSSTPSRAIDRLPIRIID